MAKITFCYIYEKKEIKYQRRKINVLIINDIELGIYFTNTDNLIVASVITGKHSGKAYPILGNESSNDKYVIVTKDIDIAAQNTGYIMNFNIIKKRLKEQIYYKYYQPDNKKSPERVIPIKDKDFLNYLDNLENNDDLDISNINEIYNQLKINFLYQDDQIKMLLSSLYKNKQLTDSSLDKSAILNFKENIIISGDVGCGKTSLLNQILEYLKIPNITIDISELINETITIKDILENLYYKYDENIKVVERGCIILNNIDLLQKENNDISNDSKIEVINNLSILLDASSFIINGEMLNTEKLSIVGIGQFDKNIKTNDKTNYKKIDLHNYHVLDYPNNFISKFSKVICMTSINSSEQLRNILINSNISPLKYYIEFFKEKNITLEYDDEFIDYIVLKASKLNMGVRGLKLVLDNYFSDTLLDLLNNNNKNIVLSSHKDTIKLSKKR